ncbi:MAG: hypothetical protein CL912_22890 [Deltaproteobacteria bacterium]|nr:hypothetical protein [Deltaproteobacteria bacterium]|tara:strand:- start:233 stop:535 length:303 start_codon:yes stop_codon:yes gene_type:complete
MSTLQLQDVSLLNVKSIFQYHQNDDVAFVAVLLVCCLFYTIKIRDKPDPHHHLWFEKPQTSTSNGHSPETRDIAQKLEQTVSISSPESILIKLYTPLLNI